MRKNNDNTNAFLIHICGFGGYLSPFGSILTPLIAWQALKNRSTFLDEQGKEAVNFNINFALYKLILSMFFVPFALSTFFRNINNNSDFEWFEFNFDLDSESVFDFLSFGSVMGLMMIIRIVLIIMASLK